MIYDIHPFLASFPAAILVCAICLESIDLLRYEKSDNFKSSAFILVILALIFTGSAFFAGYFAGENTAPYFKIPEEIHRTHHNFGRLLLISFAPLICIGILINTIKKNNSLLKGTYLIFLIVSLSLSLYTGYLGSEIVFKNGGGVSATCNEAIVCE